MNGLPCSPACERNREPILRCIRPLLADRRRVVEIGSGTGQHAAWFAPRLPALAWLRIGRVLTPSMALLIAIGLILIESLLRLRERSRWKPDG